MKQRIIILFLLTLFSTLIAQDRIGLADQPNKITDLEFEFTPIMISELENPRFYDSYLFNNNIYFAHGYSSEGALVKLDGDTFSIMPGEFNSWVRSIGEFEGDLIVGGHFTSIDGIERNRIVRWHNNNWNSIGGGISDLFYPTSIKEFDGDLYVGGAVYDDIYKSIIKWNGSSWEVVGGGTDGGIFDMEVINGELYVVGHFSQVRNDSIKGIAKWDGSSWSQVLPQSLDIERCKKIEFDGNFIYVLAELNINNLQRTRILRINPSDFSDVFEIGVPRHYDYLYEMKVYLEKVYLTTDFGLSVLEVRIGESGLFTDINYIYQDNGNIRTFIKNENSLILSSNNNLGILTAVNQLSIGVYPPNSFNQINENESFLPGMYLEIRWDDFLIDQLNLLISYNNGVSWNVISSNIDAKDKQYNLLLPNQESDQIKLKIESSSDQSIFAESKTFSIKNIEPVQLNTPENDSWLDNNIDFYWHQNFDHTESYNLQIATDQNFSEIVLDTLHTNIVVSYSLLGGQKYYWKVRGVNYASIPDSSGYILLYGPFSETRAFSTKLNAVTLNSPQNNEEVNFSAVNFTWTSLQNSSSYDFQIATDQNFQNIYFQEEGIGSLSKSVNGFTPNQQYYWRVRGKNSLTIGDWSQTRIFTAVVPVRNVSLFKAEIPDSVTRQLPCYINVMFNALNQNGRGVTDLVVQEFELLENSQNISPTESRLQIAKADQLDYRMKTVLMLDNSSSIGQSNLPIIKEAAISFVRNKLPNQEIAIYTFSENYNLLQDYTADSTALISAINSFQLGFPSTNLYGSIIQGLSRFEDFYNLEEVEQGVLVVFTDGDDTQASSTLNEVLAARGNKKIVTVGLGNEINPTVLAQIGNFDYIEVTDIAQLNAAFIALQQDLISFANSFYWMNYQSPKRGDNNHTLRLTLLNNQNSGANSYIEETFNSNGFYSVWPGIVVNPTPQNPLGIDEITIPANANQLVTIETPFTFYSQPYQFTIANPEMLQVLQTVGKTGFSFLGSAQQGQNTSVVIDDITNNYTKTITVNFDSPSSVEKNSLPTKFELAQNYPNPFNPTTKIQYAIPAVIASGAKQSINVTLKVYDILGNEVAVLVNEQKSPGTYEVNFDASSLTSGVYFYRINAGEFTNIKKMLLIK